jgi:hypothetical protein
VFSVVDKDHGCPNMLRGTWSGIALHCGPVSGHPASHGGFGDPRKRYRGSFAFFKLVRRAVERFVG